MSTHEARIFEQIIEAAGPQHPENWSPYDYAIYDIACEATAEISRLTAANKALVDRCNEFSDEAGRLTAEVEELKKVRGNYREANANDNATIHRLHTENERLRTERDALRDDNRRLKDTMRNTESGTVARLRATLKSVYEQGCECHICCTIRAALKTTDECEHVWLHDIRQLTTKENTCTLCGVPKFRKTTEG